MASKNESAGAKVHALVVQSMTVRICGESPLIMNRMSQKSKQDLLFPSGKKSASQKAVTLKHNPWDEYRNSVWVGKGLSDEPTFAVVPSAVIKGALRTAALSTPGAKKTEVGRWTWLPTPTIALYGIPRIFMSVVRSADMNRTPDIRTRALIERWAAEFTVRYVSPNLTATDIANLLVNAGMLVGIGDWRQDKGAGSFGQFRVVTDSADREYADIVASGGRAAQVGALASPEPYDDETADLLSWFSSETNRRGLEVA